MKSEKKHDIDINNKRKYHKGIFKRLSVENNLYITVLNKTKKKQTNKKREADKPKNTVF